MNEKNDEHRAPRRRLLKTVAAGGALGLTSLPGKWTRPMVASVILPAHAQTSPRGCPGTIGNCPPGGLVTYSDSTNNLPKYGTNLVKYLSGVTEEYGTLSGADSTTKYSNIGPCPAPCDDVDGSKYVTRSGSFSDGTAVYGLTGEYRCGGELVVTASFNFAGTSDTTDGTYIGTASFEATSCKYLDETRGRAFAPGQRWGRFQFGR